MDDSRTPEGDEGVLMGLTYGTFCSGIDAPGVAWKQLGWKPVFHSEIEPFPCAVLAHHDPDVPNLGDMTKVDGTKWRGMVDVLVAGTPCQAFSVAGLRGGLHDSRGNLTLRFVELVDDIDPRIVVWENVPGVLSDGTNAFGCLLAGLVGADTPLVPPAECGGRWTDAGVVDGYKRRAAWRIFDAQYLGLAQRRRRVFVVASSPDGPHPAEILFERTGVQRHYPPSREAGKRTASSTGTGAIGSLCARDSKTVGSQFVNEGKVFPWPADVAQTLDSHFGDKMGLEDQHIRGGQPCSYPQLAHAVTCHQVKGGDPTTDNYVVTGGSFDAPIGLDEEQNAVVDGFGTLKARERGGGFEGIVAFSAKDYGADASEDIAPTLRAGGADRSHANSGNWSAVAFQTRMVRTTGGQPSSELNHALSAHAGHGDSQPCVAHGMAVRRLTPVECERLQGFRDNYTAIPIGKKTKAGKTVERWRKIAADEAQYLASMGLPVKQGPHARWYTSVAADGPRYKALGNSMAVPVLMHIGKRIQGAIA